MAVILLALPGCSANRDRQPVWRDCIVGTMWRQARTDRDADRASAPLMSRLAGRWGERDGTVRHPLRALRLRQRRPGHRPRRADPARARRRAGRPEPVAAV